MTRAFVIAAAAAASLLAAGCAGGAYGPNGYGPGGFSQLDQCQRNALVGAGVGALAGAVIGSENNRVENAAIGAAVGAAGTYGACRYLGVGDAQRIQGAYGGALASGQPQRLGWQGDGGARTLAVSAPQPAPGAPNCRILTATLNVPGQGAQPLPPERYCQTPSGQWVPG